MKVAKCFIYILLIVVLDKAAAQEHITYKRSNTALSHKKQANRSLMKTTSLSLPFFDDFTGYSLYPDSTKWVDDEVYINNTMCVNPISRGVATMDALNSTGIPYDSFNNYNFRYADSLTSQFIDLSVHSPADSIYLSFFFQPQGNGFSPVPGDSLMVYMHKNDNDWKLMWVIPGTSLQPFQQVMIPVTDTTMFFNGFQFRFVNIGALNYSDAVWNIDYVRLGAGRNMYDTAVNDIAFNQNPTFMLNDYTFMPYRQFMVNPAGERAATFSDDLRNNYTTTQPVTYGYTATELTTNTPLFVSPLSNTVAPSGTTQQLTYSTYTNTIPLGGLYDKVVYENKCFIQSAGPADYAANDTIVCDQVFDNYLAYDDGSAELSYYLNLSQNFSGTLALEYHLNRPDTMQALAIYFGRQAPPPTFKQFSIVIYNSLAGVNGNYQDNKIYEQDYITPAYNDSVNDYWVYRLDTPLALPTGTFYAGILQPDYSDTLYLGLDANRVGGNHAYYNVLGQWNSSQIQGAIMMRPLLGQTIPGTAVKEITTGTATTWDAFPNPAHDNIRLKFTDNHNANYIITDIAGRTVKQGITQTGTDIDISNLVAGIYFMRIAVEGVWGQPRKIVKD
ncbi:MAG: T9SS type A sorting domain-containing protein [Flavipsychrobacter sp.]|nr:T9SS type A sorting domain-containing protein [Flavipsychrobacter sp.]